MILGAIEAGGTKFICAVGDENGNITKKERYDTRGPVDTLTDCINFFKENKVEAIGLSTFGPVDLDERSKTFGCILETPKTSWKYFPVLNFLKVNLDCPIYITTDVNGACYGEVKVGESKGFDNVLYMTIGTGIGVGAYINGKLLNTVSHPEMGHMYLCKHELDKEYDGVCPYHKGCFEGLASGPAIEKRYGKKAEELLNDVKVWELEGYYIGQAIFNMACVVNPSRIILGGGVGTNDFVSYYAKKYFKQFNNGYLKNKYIEDLDSYIVTASLGNNAGIIGSLKYAFDKLNN